MTQDASGKWVEMTDEQKLSSMSPAERAAYKAQMASYGLGETGQKLTGEEILASMSPADAAAYKAQMLSYGLDVAGNPLTEEQIAAQMTPTERSNYEITKLSNERYMQALKGDLPVDPALEKELTTEEQQIKEDLSRKLGPTWELSTPGQTALRNLQEKANLVRSEARRGEISAGDVRFQNNITSALNKTNQATGNAQTTLANRAAILSQEAGKSQTNLANLARSADTMGAFNISNTIRSGYAADRDLETSVMMQNVANKAASKQGLMQLVGAAAMAAAIASSETLKENVIPLEGALEKLSRIAGVEYDLKASGQHDIGVIAEQVEKIAPEAVTEIEGVKHVYYYKLIPLLVEALKEQQKQINKLMTGKAA
ncbi:MAG: tail fiber domain-containing protein [Desulfobacteraceae bacterium]|nr:tail fiber domain-containing protein [Desulfobacteraceae bacterium]